MNEILLLVYLADITCRLKAVLILCAVGGLFVAIMVAVRADMNGEHICKKCFIAPIIFVFLAIAIPSEKFLYSVAALKTGEIGIEKMQNSQLFKKAYEILNQKLDEALDKRKNHENFRG